MLIGLFTPDLPYQRGVRYAYRYSTTISTAFQGSSTGRNGLALDCVVDIEVVSECHLILQVSKCDKRSFLKYTSVCNMQNVKWSCKPFFHQIRNPQIKRLSHQREHSVQRLKKLRYYCRF